MASNYGLNLDNIFYDDDTPEAEAPEETEKATAPNVPSFMQTQQPTAPKQSTYSAEQNAAFDDYLK